MKIDTELTVVSAEALEKAVANELEDSDKDIEELLAKLDESDSSERTDIKNNQ